ncbi:MAG: radical SAM protein [Promethearchaeota archaeon]
MKKISIRESSGNTFYIKGRNIPKGCQLCLKGEKVVLFLNGICQKPSHCSWYCPISEERRGKNITFANEIKINSKKDLLLEIKKIKSKGMSITGGEPLSEENFKKTCEYIRFAKSKKGKKFHIHLYTNGINFNEKIADRLAEIRLDEIRFHPPKTKWSNIKLALNKGISVGAEVPVIPEEKYMKNLEKFIYYLDKIGAEFINLNEFEYCFPNSQALKNRGFKLKENSIASVENSREFAFKLLNDVASQVSIKIHFCTIIAKDYFQLRNRYLRRAKSIKLPFEVITDEGLLLYAEIEGKENILKEIYSKIRIQFRIPEKLLRLESLKIKLPFYIAIKEEFLKFLEENNLNGYIEETTPFRGEYCQTTEKTPIKIFRKEFGLYED